MIELREISFSYSPKRTILADVSVRFERGCFYGIFGPNGCGKSTLLRMITGELKPTGGEVSPVWNNALERARNLSFVEQDVPAHIPLSVKDVVALGRYPWNKGPENSEAVCHALSVLNLESLADHAYNRLSGGERQRVILARAFAQDTDCFILDEPASSLDLAYRNTFYDVLQKLARKGKCVIMVSHDLLVAPRYLDHVFLMKDGRIRYRGAARQVLSPEHLEDVFGCRVL